MSYELVIFGILIGIIYVLSLQTRRSATSKKRTRIGEVIEVDFKKRRMDDDTKF